MPARCAAAARTCRSAISIARARKCSATLDALAPYVARGVPVVGLEPSCLLTFRDELPALLKGEAVRRIGCERAVAGGIPRREQKEGRLNLPLGPLPKKALLHGHCPPNSLRRHGRGRKHAQDDPGA